MDLSIFFDSSKYENSFSLSKLILKIKEKISEEEYRALQNEINSIKKQHGAKISFLLELRNKEVAHQEVDRKNRTVMFHDIEELFKAVQEILNLLSKYNDRSFTHWDHIEENVVHSMDWMIGNLNRGEKVRLDEIEKMFEETN